MEVSDLSAGTDNLSLSEMKISLSDDIATPKVTNDTEKSLEECDATEPIGVLYRDKYRAFLTHSDIDAEFVESVMDTLEKRGISCCYSKKDFRPGTSTVSCINEAMDRSKFVICFLSKDFLTSPWCKHEREMALHKAAETSEDIIVPILMDASLEDLPMNMRRLTHIRYEDIDFEKKLFFSLGFQEGNSRPTYDDLEAANAKLNTEL
ncbi:toll-like receptor 1 [Lingula anatina]|uniref:Toll-like receptor 1 n=1 Tax=Lingula anatina TaxID=7574 RepID=A0A1S3IF25_LINAN|nr:toll-like receptor 1 [Lingula anatina]|eukprot:XP_013396456.1 toll-like receptor 1 [Lingula anatina]